MNQARPKIQFEANPSNATMRLREPSNFKTSLGAYTPKNSGKFAIGPAEEDLQ
jgi:hypothetical protein